MSTFYLAADPRSLADTLADALDDHARHGDFFAPTRVIVPNRYMRKWLRLWLARRLNVAINLDFQSLEEALWQLLQEVDANRAATAPEAIDKNVYRLMVLSVLLEKKDPHLAPLRRYLQLEGQTLTRLSCRRAWYLADRLGMLVQSYEYDRQDTLIQRWLKDQYGLGNATEFHQMMERAQRILFRHITREPDGKRALLNRSSGRTYKTFPQYAMELMLESKPTSRSDFTAMQPAVHFFGFTQLCDLHAKTMGWLAQQVDIRVYHLNVLANRLDDSPQPEILRRLAAAMRQTGEDGARDPGYDLLRLWGRSGAEALEHAATILAQPGFRAKTIRVQESLKPKLRSKSNHTVLDRVHDHLLGDTPTKTRLTQDKSLQIVGCPGIAREVETVYNSILHNLRADTTLKQTDIAVLVTDMSKYRATLQAVFERPQAAHEPKRLEYNMVDFNAAGISMFGQAVLGMLDLALDSFARSKVFSVLLNPCFLARLGIDRGQAMVWLEWAESLGIYQGWDADEKEKQGYPRSPFYAWRLGLQRLRLGRYMEVTREDAGEPAPRFAHVIPFADLDSTDREQLDAFGKAVEGLLPTLARLRSTPMTGRRWASALERLVQEFLDVPADRPEEAQVQGELLAAFGKLTSWDDQHEGAQKSGGLPLALVREYVRGQLEVLEGNRGEYLIGGVTVSALQPMRPVPFEIIYILGLGEDLFPGSNALSSFDLRGAHRAHGDFRPAEDRLYDFLATVLAAQRKLYLLYNNRDLQKDQALLPSAALLQLQRHLGRHILKSEFEPVAMPAQGDDERFLDPARQPEYQDVLVQYRDAERCLAIHGAEQEHHLTLAPVQQAEWSRHWKNARQDFSVHPPLEEVASAAKNPPPNVTLAELKRFLQLPAHASLRRHLRVEEEDDQALADDEPLVTPKRAGDALVRQTLHQLVLAAAQGDVQKAIATWQVRFAETYADAGKRCRVPEEAFAEIDQAAIQGELQERIHGQGQIETFLRQHASLTFCGPVLLGESLVPLGARLRFPALRLRPGHELPAEIPQEVRLIGWTHFAWQSPNRFEILLVTNSKDIDGRKISASLFEPALLHLAMLAHAEPNAAGDAAQTWLAQREVQIHIAYRAGIQTWTYPVGSVTPAEAAQYLAELVRDFLDPKQFDLLPFEVISRHTELPRAFNSTFAVQTRPDDYRKILEIAIEDVRENPFSAIEIPLLVEMIHAEVPADALAKVQRRFRLLDRGPARFRQQPPAPKPRRPALS